jgi:transcriptional regulator with XRE-family HTH domain
MSTLRKTKKRAARKALPPYRLKIRELRKSIGLTQAQLAEKMGVLREAVARWETGSRGLKNRHLLELWQLAEKENLAELATFFVSQIGTSAYTRNERFFVGTSKKAAAGDANAQAVIAQSGIDPDQLGAQWAETVRSKSLVVISSEEQNAFLQWLNAFVKIKGQIVMVRLGRESLIKRIHGKIIKGSRGR